MRLTEHFALAEFERSARAEELGIDNSVPAALLEAVTGTAVMLERIRAALGRIVGRDVPLSLTSGYRCAEVNRAVGSKPSSDHIKGCAADFVAPSFGTPYQVALALAPQVRVLGIGQLIYERNSRGGVWVHVSTRVPVAPANRVITIGPGGVVQLGIQED